MMKSWTLSTTLLFTRQVIHDKFPIDTALCGVLEYACCLLIVSIGCTKPNVRGVHATQGSPSQTRFQTALANLPENPLLEQSLPYVLVEPLTDLLRRVAIRLDTGPCIVFGTIGG